MDTAEAARTVSSEQTSIIGASPTTTTQLTSTQTMVEMMDLTLLDAKQYESIMYLPDVLMYTNIHMHIIQHILIF